MHYRAIFMRSARVHVHMYMHMYMHTYMHTYALCGYTRHLRTCRYAAILVNWPSGISQAAAIAVNRTQGVKMFVLFWIYVKFIIYILKIIPHMIRSYYRCCCINEPVYFSHCVHLKLGHRFHALLKVYSDRDDTVLLSKQAQCGVLFIRKV